MRRLRITIENKSYDVTVEDLSDADSYHAPLTPGSSHPTSTARPQTVQAAVPAKPQLPIETGAVTSPMAGVIKSVLVKPGDSVKQGQPLVVLEAMKMENQITAPLVGTVKRVNVSVGESVQEGHVLVVLE